MTPWGHARTCPQAELLLLRIAAKCRSDKFMVLPGNTYVYPVNCTWHSIN